MSEFFNKIISSSVSEREAFESSKRDIQNQIESAVRHSSSNTASSWRLRERGAAGYVEA